MEFDLQQIAEGVRSNISEIFERGEKFSMLANKSEGLKMNS